MQWPNGQAIIYQTHHRKLKIEQREPNKNWLAVDVPHVTTVVLLLNDTNIICDGQRVGHS